MLNYDNVGLVCSPTRSMLLTGRFDWNHGLSLQKTFNTTLGNLLQDYTDYHTHYVV